MEKPQKPELNRVERQGSYGEIIIELDKESETAWAEYLRKLGFYKRALALELLERESNDTNNN